MEKYSRRTVLAALAACLSAAAFDTRAEGYPNRPIRIITPSTAGSSVDILARRIAKFLGDTFGSSVYVDNLAGAGGIIGTQQLIHAKPDGYTLAVVAKSLVITPLINKAARYNALTQTTTVCMLQESCSILVASKRFPANNIAQMVESARKNPGKINWGFGGLGTTNDLQGRLVQQLAGIQVTNVAYKGAAGLMVDLVAGTVDVAVMAMPTVSEHIRNGSLKPLGITRQKRISALPGVPTISEQLPGFKFDGWYALIGPAEIPDNVTSLLSKDIRRLQGQPAYIQAAAMDGETPLVMDSKTATAFLAEESQQVGKLLKKTDLPIK